jgi:hypothetical protein
VGRSLASYRKPFPTRPSSPAGRDGALSNEVFKNYPLNAG